LTWYASPEHTLLTPFAGLMAFPLPLFVSVKVTVLQSQQHKMYVNTSTLLASMVLGGQITFASCLEWIQHLTR
jgi:hypothetical protein